MNIIEALTNPETFFKKLSQKDISLKEPFLIVLIFSILISTVVPIKSINI